MVAGRVQEAIGDQGGKVEPNNHREVQDYLPHLVLPLQTGGQTNLCIRRLRLKKFYLALDMNLNLKSNLELNLKLNQEPSRKLFGCLNINLQMSVCGL